MSLFSRIVDVHRKWLYEKGYSEFSIQADEKEGSFIDRLKESLKNAVSKSMWDDAPRIFTVDLQGSFGVKMDKVEFEFQYEYEPQHIKLNLKSVVATMGDIQQVYLIQPNTHHSLPDSKKVYDQLVKKAQQVADQQLVRYQKPPGDKGLKVSLK